VLLISWITVGPSIVASAGGVLWAFHTLVVLPPAGSTSPPTFNPSWAGPFIVAVLVIVVGSGFLTGVAQAGVVWAVTREAAGRPAPVGAALRYGLRNGVRLWGWSLLYGLMVLAGTCACFLPGLYFALAGCLYVPVALYRRGMNPITTSFSLVNGALWAALGRMAMLLLLVYGVELVVSVPVQILSLGFRGLSVPLTIGLQFVTAPLTTVLTVGTVLLFAELSVRQLRIETTTASLDAALV
jgi:hypothetical protein